MMSGIFKREFHFFQPKDKLFEIVRFKQLETFGRLPLLLQHEMWDDDWIHVCGAGRSWSIRK